ncbi:MAG: acetyl-CoA carboxylase biotin carboxylase subunit [Myxococcota bacterium]
MKKLLIANRGEIAVRIAHGCSALGIASVAVYSDADIDAPHVVAADEAIRIGKPPAHESYLDPARILAAAKATGADAIHPGYGFLSENAGFAEAVMAAGLIWVGPNLEAIRAMGAKIESRRRMETAGVPLVPGIHNAGQGLDALIAAANSIGFPLLVKASAGGGGKGMRAVHSADALEEAITSARREAQSAFADSSVYVERLLLSPRHVEIQVFGDTHGNVVHLGERECSIQRRHQKVLEEAPSVALTPAIREAMGAAAVQAARAVDYVGAGTVEFMLDADGSFFFLEMNTRLQVEHPITEQVYGVDLVAAQLRIARGEALPWSQADLTPRGHAIEVRLYAEDPARGFLPQTGTLHRYRPPAGPGVRHDGGYREGNVVGVHYDPMLAKLIVTAENRPAAIARLQAALATWEVHGVTTNLPFLQAVAAHPAYAAGDTFTSFVGTHFPDGLPAATIEPDAIVGEDALIALAVAQALGAISTNDAGATARDAAQPWHLIGPWRGCA